MLPPPVDEPVWNLGESIFRDKKHDVTEAMRPHGNSQRDSGLWSRTWRRQGAAMPIDGHWAIPGLGAWAIPGWTIFKK